MHHFAYTNISEIILPETLVEIPSHCFIGSNLRRITIPRSIVSIQVGAFIECIYLEEFTSNSPHFKVFNKGLYSADLKSLYGFPSNSFSDLCPTTQFIKSSRGFSGSSFTNYVFTLPIRELELFTFRKCPNLVSVDLSCILITKMSDGLFINCKNLTTVIMPSSISSIDTAFSSTNIKTITIPARVYSIHMNAFENSPITNIYYCWHNVINTRITTNNSVKIIVSQLYPSSSSTFLGFEIVNRNYECPITACNLLTNQIFIKCKTVFQCSGFPLSFLYIATSMIII